MSYRLSRTHKRVFKLGEELKYQINSRNARNKNDMQIAATLFVKI